MYDTHEEANQKLTACVVLFKGSPVYIEEAFSKIGKVFLRYSSIRDGKGYVEDIRHEDWEFRNLGHRIGYANFEKESLYCLRSAVRNAHNTQGLSYRNMKFCRFRDPESAPRPDWYYIGRSETVADMLEGKYPTFQDTIKMFENPLKMSVAFDRDFSIYRHQIGPFYLEYKGKEIGYSEDTDSWKVDKKFLYLGETLEDKQLKVK